MGSTILVGCSGRAGLPLGIYASLLRAMEVQETFYRTVRDSTLEGWREEVGDSFSFTLKAFQGVSHPRSSPTWRRAGRSLLDMDPKGFGLLRRTEAVMRSWDETIRMAADLRAEYIVIQLPPSFMPSMENLRAIEEFSSAAKRIDGVGIGIELRGEGWRQLEGELRGVLEGAALTHVVDPLSWSPVHVAGAAYFRLHGRLPGYDYQYRSDELERVKEIAEGFRQSYVFMNNLAMLEDAIRLDGMMRTHAPAPKPPDVERRVNAISRATKFPTTIGYIRRRYGYLRVDAGAEGEPTLAELLGDAEGSVKLDSPEDLLRLLANP